VTILPQRKESLAPWYKGWIGSSGCLDKEVGKYTFSVRIQNLLFQPIASIWPYPGSAEVQQAKKSNNKQVSHLLAKGYI
jgi:hypothetical protein